MTLKRVHNKSIERIQNSGKYEFLVERPKIKSFVIWKQLYNYFTFIYGSLDLIRKEIFRENPYKISVILHQVRVQIENTLKSKSSYKIIYTLTLPYNTLNLTDYINLRY